MKQVSAPIQQRCFHDAHLWLALFAFFIAIALPLKWHTIMLWSLCFGCTAFLQRVKLKFILYSLIIAFILSTSIWLLNVLFHTENISTDQVLIKANQTALKIWTLTWVALLSAKMLNIRDVITYALQRQWLSTQIAYAMLVGIGSITLLRTETQRIRLNAKLRGINGIQKFSQWIPLLIFSLRHAQRGAMSLRSRGLAQHKVFYYDYQATQRQSTKFVVLLICLTLLSVLSEVFL